MIVKLVECFKFLYGKLEEGSVVDIVVFDLEKEVNIDLVIFYLKGKNILFVGEMCIGWLVVMFLEGIFVYNEGEIKW